MNDQSSSISFKSQNEFLGYKYRYFDRFIGKTYITIFELELIFSAYLSLLVFRREIGGELYGLCSHGGRSIICYASQPGPKSICSSSRFKQDLDRLREESVQKYSEHYIQIHGEQHSHWELGLSEPSPRDQFRMASMSRRNNIDQTCEIIFTHERRISKKDSFVLLYTDYENAETELTLPCPLNRKNQISFSVRANSFVYYDAKNGLYTRCPMKIIRGMSPVRLAELHNPQLFKYNQAFIEFLNQVLVEAPHLIPNHLHNLCQSIVSIHFRKVELKNTLKIIENNNAIDLFMDRVKLKGECKALTTTIDYRNSYLHKIISKQTFNFLYSIGMTDINTPYEVMNHVIYRIKD